MTNYTYPPKEWSKLSPEGKAFMTELKQVFHTLKYEGTTAPPGIVPFNVDRKGKSWTEQ